MKCLCCACGDVCSGPKQEIRYLEVENFDLDLGLDLGLS